MASVSTNKKTGTRRVLFVNADEKRTALHVGRISLAAAIEIGVHVEHLVLCRRSREDVRRSTREWIHHIRRQWPRLARRLVSLNLISPSITSSTTPCRGDVAVADYADQLIKARTDIRPNTIRLWQQTAVRIREHLGLLTIGNMNAKHARDFKRWLLSPSDNGGAGYGRASAGKHIAVAKSFLKEAMDAGIIDSNPFVHVTIQRQKNSSRQRFIESEAITKVINQCEDDEMKAVIALSRWGGLRTPSEPFAMKWRHINWDRRRIQIQCVKTETKGRPTREIPLFPELVPFLNKLRERLSNDSPDSLLITGLKDFTDANLRKQMTRLVQSAGFEVWPRIFHNLRSSRQTELEERFPRKTVCEWMGNSEQVADQHYLQVRDEHFKKAAERGSAETP